METINVIEKEATTNEDLYLSIKNRESEDVIVDLLAGRYGWAFDSVDEIEGYVWAERASGYGHYIIHYQVYNFPVSKINVPDFSIEDFRADLADDDYEWYTDDTFDGVIEKIELN
ncbi:hypothetical protein [Dysgonomonas macrotermitis]|uniref:Uncharacterized protein n=1 Tax=Dysgonomonas macrotermitis TaxID=1346286 RepID=A0A1M4WYA6_9BACT|nr:hypothetical protein [Dysgonomonas macrotermitis]SHE86271.1 hypothetical protein SAMN05444362_102354 [Dysgonomonas macrotermitis]